MLHVSYFENHFVNCISFSIHSFQKEFIQIVEPLTLRPREGDSVTGFLKLRKTVSVIKVGKKVVENYRQRIKEVLIINQYL